MKKLNVLWMYPDMLNNFGDRGNFFALSDIGEKLGVEVEIRKILDYGEDIDFTWPDIILFNSGELRTTEAIVSDLKRYEDELESYIESGKYIFAFNSSGTIFGKTCKRSDGSVLEGLGILDIDFEEKIHIYGDSLYVKAEGYELLGSQISMVNAVLGEKGVPFGKVLYGYGNNYRTDDEGARYKNLIYTNVIGPLFTKNPWYCKHIIKSIIGEEEPNKEFSIDYYREEFPVECKSFETLLEYDRGKPHVTEEKKKYYYK